jgi:flagellar motor switch protein FliG
MLVEDTASTQIDGATAAAILLMLLSDDDAAAILQGLEPDHVRTIGQTMFKVADASEIAIETALDLFVDECRGVSALSIGAEPRIRTVITQAVGNTRADNILSEIAPQNSASVVEILRWMDVPTLSNILRTEHPQVCALLLAVLKPEIAAEALVGITDDALVDLLTRAARLTSVTGDAIHDLELILSKFTTPISSAPPFKLGGQGDAARIVNKMKRDAGQRVLKSIKKKDRVLGQAIEDEMFIFDNLNDLDDKALGTILRSVDAATLTVALKGTEAALADRMFACMSARAAQSIRDEMAEGGPTKRSDVEEAQKQIIVTARKLADEGSVTLGGGGDDYV